MTTEEIRTLLKEAGLGSRFAEAATHRKAGKDAKILSQTHSRMKKRGLVKKDGSVTNKINFGKKDESNDAIGTAKETWDNLSSKDKVTIGGTVAVGAGKLLANKVKAEKEEKERRNSKKGGSPIIING